MSKDCTNKSCNENCDWCIKRDLEKKYPTRSIEDMLVKYDPIDRPAHYTEGRQYEPADVILDWRLSWLLGNVVKYIARAGRKSDELEDLRKARWYLDRRITELSK